MNYLRIRARIFLLDATHFLPRVMGSNGQNVNSEQQRKLSTEVLRFGMNPELNPDSYIIFEDVTDTQ